MERSPGLVALRNSVLLQALQAQGHLDEFLRLALLSIFV